MTPKNKTVVTAVPGSLELFITREFDAPRELVFRAFTEAEIYAKWLTGPPGLTMDLERFEPWSGGSWRYIQTDTNGNSYAFHGVNHEVRPPERIIGTFEFEGLPESGHVVLETVRFESLPGNRTRLVNQSVFQSVADRDGMIRAGMESGVSNSYDQLDIVLTKL